MFMFMGVFVFVFVFVFMFKFMLNLHKHENGHGHDSNVGYMIAVKKFILISDIMSASTVFSQISEVPISAQSDIVHQGYRTGCPPV
jgi:heme/copper-type cytochrome/quinol oxidase subunit 2